MDSLSELRSSLGHLRNVLQSSKTMQIRSKDGRNSRAHSVLQIPEILAEIFFYTLPTETFMIITPTLSPLNISQVCGFWRTVAVGFPPLWRRFALTFDEKGDFEAKIRLLTLIMGRARNSTLSIKLVFGKRRASRLLDQTVRLTNRVMQMLTHNDVHSINDICLALPPDSCPTFIESMDFSLFRSIRSLAIDVFGNYDQQRILRDFDFQLLRKYPKLESLALLNYTVTFSSTNVNRYDSLRQLVLIYDFVPGCETGERTRLNSNVCLNALRLCPSLERLSVSLHWSATSQETNSIIQELCTPVNHDKLRQLCVIAGDAFGELDAFLGFLRLSCLRTFELRSRSTAILSNGFQTFMSNSPTIEEIALFGRNTPSDVILECLAMLPNVKHLSLIQLPHVGSFLEALSHRPGYIQKMDKKRICTDLETLMIEDTPGKTIPVEVLSHFIRCRRWPLERTIRGPVLPDSPSRLRLLRVPTAQTMDLLKLKGVRECVENGLIIEQYDEEHSPGYLSGKDFFHL